MIKTQIKRSRRDTPPAHYMLKIKSFSQLSEIARDGIYESDEFEAGDYKWKLVLYPNGNLKANGEGHISLYLASSDAKAISTGCHVNMLFSFFVYDHIRDKYLTIQDGKTKRFYVLRTKHGFDQLLPLAEFNDQTNGYVVDDCCVFGAEVHVIKNKVKGNELSFIKNPPNGTFTWKVDKFSTLDNKRHYSEVFSAGGCQWILSFNHKGQSEEKGRSLSLYLNLAAAYAAAPQSKVHAKYKLLVKDQINGIHIERKG
ncbi:ubiquitin C-terminal hydrolase 12-like isoform X3 [Euphorbia lathyris]|uniref:ubiquitin C-terminal hydrolase 12-like isoform X3 n=1 Tax=Euphorbia lathyris TaxID=212925 RepID=UPI003313FE68